MSHHLSYLRSPLTTLIYAPCAGGVVFHASRLCAQFFWQDYQDRSYVTAFEHLVTLRGEGKIKNLGLCNFDTRRTEEICVTFGPGAIVTNQVAVRGSSRLCDVAARSSSSTLIPRRFLCPLVFSHRCAPPPWYE